MLYIVINICFSALWLKNFKVPCALYMYVLSPQRLRVTLRCTCRVERKPVTSLQDFVSMQNNLLNSELIKVLNLMISTVYTLYYC